MKKKIGITILVILVAIVIIGVGITITQKTSKDSNGQFKIVTTFYPILIMTSNITQGAQNIELVNMTELNSGCLHDYTLSTQDMRKLEKANVIVQNGLGLENFMDKILKTYSKMKVIDSGKNVTDKIEENGEVNNHIWTSISNYILQVEEVTKGLSEANPENRQIYEKNSENYIQELKELQERYQTELNVKGKKAICLNEAFSYLAKEIGLEIISVPTNHEESSLSAEKMKDLIETIKKEQISVILVDSQDNLKSAQTLANETGARIFSLQSGLIGDVSNHSYIQLMQDNLEVLKGI